VKKKWNPDVAAARKNCQAGGIMRTGFASSRRALTALAVALCVVSAWPAQAITSNNHFTSAVPVTSETAYTGVFESGAQPCTGLFGADNPVDGSDPSGHDDLASLSVSESLGAGLDSMYNGGVVIAGNALQKTLIGVQNGETANAILEGYLKDVAIGAGIGVAIGAVADIAGDLVYGGNIQGETVVIEVNTPTFGASQNFARAESTTEDLMGAAARAANTVKAQNPGVTQGAVYGTKVHSEFANDVVAMGLNSEVSYYMGEVKPYGYPGSVRLDVVKGDVERPQAIWDLKTGSAKLTDARIQQIRKHLPPGYQDIPIAEIKP